MILAVFFLLGTHPLFCTVAQAEKKGMCPYFGDAIIVASSGDARTLVPILASDSASSDICGLVYNGLVKYDKNIELVGDLAESWEVLDDGKIILFHLRKGVVWHDGTPFTARDVEFTYRKLIDPNVPTPYGGDFEKVSAFIVHQNENGEVFHFYRPHGFHPKFRVIQQFLLFNVPLGKQGRRAAGRAQIEAPVFFAGVGNRL